MKGTSDNSGISNVIKLYDPKTIQAIFGQKFIKAKKLVNNRGTSLNICINYQA